jgi:hypothetical protein
MVSVRLSHVFILLGPSNRKRYRGCATTGQSLLGFNGTIMEIMSVSPCKNFEVRTEVWEARNSLWVYSPSVWDVERDHCIFSFNDENWSADTSVWEDEATVRLTLRKFPGNHRPYTLMVEIDCLGLRAKMTSRLGVEDAVATTLKAQIIGPAKDVALKDLETALDEALTFE